jgi:hypothetical protein
MMMTSMAVTCYRMDRVGLMTKLLVVSRNDACISILGRRSSESQRSVRIAQGQGFLSPNGLSSTLMIFVTSFAQSIELLFFNGFLEQMRARKNHRPLLITIHYHSTPRARVDREYERGQQQSPSLLDKTVLRKTTSCDSCPCRQESYISPGQNRRIGERNITSKISVVTTTSQQHVQNQERR